MDYEKIARRNPDGSVTVHFGWAPRLKAVLSAAILLGLGLAAQRFRPLRWLWVQLREALPHYDGPGFRDLGSTPPPSLAPVLFAGALVLMIGVLRGRPAVVMRAGAYEMRAPLASHVIPAQEVAAIGFQRRRGVTALRFVHHAEEDAARPSGAYSVPPGDLWAFPMPFITGRSDRAEAAADLLARGLAPRRMSRQEAARRAAAARRMVRRVRGMTQPGLLIAILAAAMLLVWPELFR